MFIVRMPSSEYHLPAVSWVMMFFLKESSMERNGRISCLRLSSSGIRYADWMEYLLEPLLATKSTSSYFRTMEPERFFPDTGTTPTSTLKPRVLRSL
jgi:hypothetical protein